MTFGLSQKPFARSSTFSPLVASPFLNHFSSAIIFKTTKETTKKLTTSAEMATVVSSHCRHTHLLLLPKTSSPAATFASSNSLLFSSKNLENSLYVANGGTPQTTRKTRKRGVLASSLSNVAAPFWDSWKPEKGAKAPGLSDIVWPSVGGFAAMAVLGKMDQVLASKGLSVTIAPLGAVCAVLFATPSSPGARKYNMFIAQIGCAAIGVLAFSIFGPGWLARSSGLAAAIAFMICTGSVHPPAASLPLLFIDGAKLHPLNFWYALFPGATGCIVLCLIQEMVSYLKVNFKF